MIFDIHCTIYLIMFSESIAIISIYLYIYIYVFIYISLLNLGKTYFPLAIQLYILFSSKNLFLLLIGNTEPDLIVDCTPSKNGPFSSTRDNLKSCLTKNMNTVKKCITMSPVASAKKNVVFGSPKVVEFFKTSPATNMTPMRRDTARKMFSMDQKEDGVEEEEDSNIIDNSDEWDRLTNTSGGSPEPSDDEPSPLPLPIPGSPAFNKRYYATDDVDVSPVRAPFIANATSILRRSPRRSCNMSVASNISQTSNDVTGTILLPGTLAELVNQATTSGLSIIGGKQMKMNDLSMRSDVESLSMSRDDCTEELEIDLHSLMHRHHEDLPPTLDSNESDRSTSLSVKSNNTSRYSDSSSVPSLGPLLGLSPSGSMPKYSQGNMTEELSVSSPMSSVCTNESVLTIKENSSCMKRLDTATFKNCDMNNSLTSMGDGATVELEGGLHDMMEELNSVTNSKKKCRKIKKRLSLRTKSTPQMKTSQIDISSPWVGDMSIISTVDDDHTTRFEDNSGDLMAGVTSSGARSSPSSPVAFLSTGSPSPSPSILGPGDVVIENICISLLDKKEIQEERDEKIDEEYANEVSTVSTRSDIFDINDSIMINRAARTNLALTTVRSSDIDYFNLVQGPDSYSSYADTSICSVADNSVDVSVMKGGRRSSVAGSAMMQRLHALNVGARLNSLDQCGTPLAAKGSMSIGMKRHSLLARSTTKKSRASLSAAFNSRQLQSASAKGIYNPLVNMGEISCSTPSKYDVLMTAKTSSANEDVDTFSEVPESIQDSLPSVILTPHVPILISKELREEFSAVALYRPISATEFSSSVLQAIATDLTDGEYCSEVQCAVNDIMRDVMTVANEETRTEARSIENMQRIWSDFRPDADVMEDAGTLIGINDNASDVDEIMKMKIVAEKCKEMSRSNWSEFEDKLFAAATVVVDERNVEILKEITLKKQKSTEKSMKNNDDNNIASAKSVEGRKKLKELQTLLENARKNLISSAEILRATQEKVSSNLEIKKDSMIAMIVQKETNERELKISAEKEKNELALMESKAAYDLLTAKKELHNVKQSLGLLNRLTYCRVLSYQSTCIEIEAVLSSQLRIQIIFHLSLDESNGKLYVDGAHVDLKYLDPQGLTVKITNTDKKKIQEWDSDTMLANAYFSDVMCSDDVSGPLSEVMLSQVLCPADIPSVMQRVSTHYIDVMFRRILYSKLPICLAINSNLLFTSEERIFAFLFIESIEESLKKKYFHQHHLIFLSCLSSDFWVYFLLSAFKYLAKLF